MEKRWLFFHSFFVTFHGLIWIFKSWSGTLLDFLGGNTLNRPPWTWAELPSPANSGRKYLLLQCLVVANGRVWGRYTLGDIVKGKKCFVVSKRQVLAGETVKQRRWFKFRNKRHRYTDGKATQRSGLQAVVPWNKCPMSLMYSLKFAKREAPEKYSQDCFGTVGKSSFHEGQRKAQSTL